MSIRSGSYHKGMYLLVFALPILCWILNAMNDFQSVIPFDGRGYLALATNLSEHREFSMILNDVNRFPDSFRTPIYPLFLALFKQLQLGLPAILFIQAILAELTTLISLNTLKALTQHLTSKWALLLGLGFNIPLAIFSQQIMSETLACLLLTAGLAIFLKNKTIWAGLLLSICVLTRPSLLLIAIGLPITMMLAKRITLKPLAVYFIALVIGIAPWLVRNQVTFGAPFLANVGPSTAVYFLSTSVEAQHSNLSVEQIKKQHTERIKSQYDWNQTSSSAAAGRDNWKIALNTIMDHPITSIQQFAITVMRIAGYPLNHDMNPTIHGKEWVRIILIVVQLCGLLAIWSTLLVYFMISGRNPNGMVITMLLLFALAIFPGGISVGIARLRVPAIPLLYLAWALALPNTLQWLNGRIRPLIGLNRP